MPNASDAPIDATPSAIAVRGLTKTFGEVRAVDAIDLDVRPGELFFLLGPSGCGKTTLLRMLAGLETPDTGSVRFFGEDVARRPPHLRGAPMVFQHYALWPHLSVYDNVAFGLVERGVDKKETRDRVDEALRLVGLRGLDPRKPAQLSGGQQQRVALARALVISPGILLLDEPLANLDAKLRHEMRDEIERLHAETDIAFIYVTHDQSEALSLADRMAVMDRGKVMASGAPDALYHRPPNAFTATFLGEANIVPGTVRELHQAVAIIETPVGPWAATGDLSALAWNQPVDCVVRPENIRPVFEEENAAPSDVSTPTAAATEDAAEAPPPPPRRGNRIGARVLRTRVNGATVSAQLEATTRGNGTCPLRAMWLNRPRGSEASASIRKDDALVFSIDAEAVTVLPRGDAPATPSTGEAES